MKKIFPLLILALATTLLVNAQTKAHDKEKAVQQTVTDLFQALADGDPVKLKQHCTADILILENGMVWNLDTLVQKVTQNIGPDFKRISTLEFMDTKISGKIAWTTYYNRAEVSRNGKTGIIKWLETAVLSKEDGQWKVKTLHSTLLKRT